MAAEDDKVVVDLGNCRNDVWLLKVPAAVEQAWATAPVGAHLGRIKVYDHVQEHVVGAKRGRKHAKMTLEIDPKVLDNVYNVDKTVLPQHLKVEEMLSDSHRNQVTLGVLTEDGDRWDSTTVGSLAIDGTVAKRLETKFMASEALNVYMKQTHRKHADTRRTATTTTRAEQNPTANRHLDQIKREAMLNRRTQEDTETVKEKLFGLFAAHEYFTLDELAEQTDQPKSHLTKILETIAEFETSGSNRNRWHLKAAHRYYDEEE